MKNSPPILVLNHPPTIPQILDGNLDTSMKFFAQSQTIELVLMISKEKMDSLFLRTQPPRSSDSEMLVAGRSCVPWLAPPRSATCLCDKPEKPK